MGTHVNKWAGCPESNLDGDRKSIFKQKILLRSSTWRVGLPNVITVINFFSHSHLYFLNVFFNQLTSLGGIFFLAVIPRVVTEKTPVMFEIFGVVLVNSYRFEPLDLLWIRQELVFTKSTVSFRFLKGCAPDLGLLFCFSILWDGICRVYETDSILCLINQD